jgi:uncharacterized membrane protein
MIATVAWLFSGARAGASEVDTFYCAGSEPIWEISVQAGQGRFGTILDGARALVGAPQAMPGGEPGWRGQASDGVELLLRFETAACTNPLLQEPARYQALMVIGGAAQLSGCCRLALNGAAVADGGSQSTPGEAPPAMAARVRAAPGNMVNVREHPVLIPGNVLTKLPAGTGVELAGAEIHQGELWYRVRLAGTAGVGWIRGDLIEQAAASPPDEAQASWQMRPELIPAIDRCLEEVTARPALVTKAYGDAMGAVGVRLMDAEGRRWACTRGAGSAEPELNLVEGTDRLPGEFRPLFLRAPDEPTRDPCYRHEPLHDGAGQIVGWLSFGLCS